MHFGNALREQHRNWFEAGNQFSLKPAPISADTILMLPSGISSTREMRETTPDLSSRWWPDHRYRKPQRHCGEHSSNHHSASCYSFIQTDPPCV